MTIEPTDAEVEAALRAAKTEWQDVFINKQTMRAALLAAARVRSAIPEAVAWQQRDKRHDGAWSQWYPTTRESWDQLQRRSSDLFEVRALYIHPVHREGFVLVPQSAIDWLTGSGPDANGKWFGEVGESYPVIKSLGTKPPFWWRSHFQKLIAASPATGEREP